MAQLATTGLLPAASIASLRSWSLRLHFAAWRLTAGEIPLAVQRIILDAPQVGKIPRFLRAELMEGIEGTGLSANPESGFDIAY